LPSMPNTQSRTVAPFDPPRSSLIVVGSGIAGLRAAIEAASAGLRVIILSKDPPSKSATEKAQGGIAVALSDEDEVGLHQMDTLAAGAGLCDEAAVQVMVESGPSYIGELIDWGAEFDREGSRLAFTREGAHSASRVLHAGGDSTGQEILRTLLEKALTFPQIKMLTSIHSVDLIVIDGICRGVICLEEGSGELRSILGSVLLATGGCGRIYRESSNPPQATGDGLAMAYRAGAWMRDMEFVQFHPTSLAVQGAPRFLLSEALRGEGGVLRSGSTGERFMLAVDAERAELAPRDVVSRAIFSQQAADKGAPVGLDMTRLDPGYLRKRFPRIHATCLKYGVDMSRMPIPVSPSAHYLMGGVATDLHGRTSITGLYASGEVACTGVHGANRLASNSLLEGLVFGARTGATVATEAHSHPDLDSEPDIDFRFFKDIDSIPGNEAESVMGQVRELTWTQLGIYREAGALDSARTALTSLLNFSGEIEATRAGVEARNMAIVARLVAEASLRRKESRGAHFRQDYPALDDVEFKVSFADRIDGAVERKAR
jgi:L-aspartate oxidase